MPTNQIYEFATSSAAYVEALATYASDTERTAGQQSGVARAELNNRALRQANAVSAAIGEFMVNQGYDCLDDGDTATRASDFALAVAALIAPDITSAVNAAKLNVLQTVYPVGSLYISVTSATNPNSLLGFGTWQRVQGRVILGASSQYTAGSTGGSATHTLTTSEMPSHTHTASSASAGAHTHTASSSTTGAHTHTGTAASAGAHTHSGTTGAAGAHTHTRGTMEITGYHGSEALVSMGASGNHPFGGAFYISAGQGGHISANVGGNSEQVNFQASRSWSGSTSSAGGHTHSFTTGSAGAHTHSVSVGSAGNHSHTISIGSAGSHSHTITVASTGGGSAFSTMDPYLAAYIWRRTA